jgi:hypothetical protein
VLTSGFGGCSAGGKSDCAGARLPNANSMANATNGKKVFGELRMN